MHQLKLFINRSKQYIRRISDSINYEGFREWHINGIKYNLLGIKKYMSKLDGYIISPFIITNEKYTFELGNFTYSNMYRIYRFADLNLSLVCEPIISHNHYYIRIDHW